jgi:hypothetical protein
MGDLEKLVERAIKIVADEAWGIAFMGNCPAPVCLAIEALSDDPERCRNLVESILEPVQFGLGEPPTSDDACKMPPHLAD